MKRSLVVVTLVIALLAICAGSVVAVLPALADIRAGRIQFGLFSLGRVGADRAEEKRLAVSDPVTLTVDTPNGKVDVTGVKGASEVVIRMHKYAWGASQDAANSLLEKLVVNIDQTGGSIRVRVEQPVEFSILHLGTADTQVDFTITVPEDSIVKASSDFGDVNVADTTKDASLETNFGEVHARNIAGGLTASSKSGKVVATDVGSVEAAVSASSDFGEVYLEDVTALSVTGRSNAGDVTLLNAKVEDLAEISTDFGALRMERVEASRATLHANSGRVTITDVTVAGKLTAESSFGDVICTSSSASNYGLMTSSGRVEGEGLRGDVTAHSNFGDVRLAGTDVVMDASTNSGKVVFSGTLGDGLSVLQSNLGDVAVFLPEGSQFHADLKTDLGSIHTDFPIDGGYEAPTHLVGDVGEGGPKLKASTSAGSVEVRILSDAANPAASQ